MYQLNPLLESKKHLLKILSRYTPQERSKIRERMLSLGKDNGGWYDPHEYGKRMIDGQIKRIEKAAKQHNRNVIIKKDNRARTTFQNNEPDLIRYTTQPPSFDRNEEIFYSNKIGNDKNHSLRHSFSRRFIRKKLRDERNAIPELIGSDTLSHEADEYIQSLKLAKKHNISDPSLIIDITKPVQHRTGNHNPGVLDKEAKRYHLLSTLYGRDSFAIQPRDKYQFAKNKVNYVMNHDNTKSEIQMVHICNKLGIKDPYNLESIQNTGMNIDSNPILVNTSKETRDKYYNLLGKWYDYVKRRFQK